jgi:hypothetical protein
VSAIPKVLTALIDVSDALAARGAPPLSPYWRQEAERFYMHPTASTLVEMVGRGGDKSRTSVIMAIAETLAGDFAIAPGERHYFTHISENVAEATKTLRVLEQYLGLLGIPYTRSAETIELANMPRGFKVLASRVGAVSGWRCYGWTADEAAKWSNEGADPTEEVVASMRAMTVTHQNARGRIISSPLGMLGFFYEAHAQGNTDAQLVGHATSWQANPAITEAATRRLEPSERVWRREYAAIPQSGLLSCFDADAVDSAFKRTVANHDFGESVLIVDAASGGADAFTYCAAHYAFPRQRRWLSERRFVSGANKWVRVYLNDEKGNRIPDPDFKPEGDRPVLRLEGFGSFPGGFWGKLTGGQIADTIAGFCRARGIRRGFGDQREALMLTSSFSERGILYAPLAWTATSKPPAVERVRELLRDGSLSLESSDQLRKELLSFEEKVNPNGQITFSARRSGHDDLVALLITAAMAEAEGAFPASPVYPRRIERSVNGFVV